MSWLITPQQKFKALLDEYPGAGIAYSLRRLTYKQDIPVIRVQRSSDSTQRDFYAEDITNGTVTAFCGSGTGYAVIWYDQSGNGFHTRFTGSDIGPRIVINGSLQTDGGVPTLNFTNNTSYQSSFQASFPFSAFITFRTPSTLNTNVRVAGHYVGGMFRFTNLGELAFTTPAGANVAGPIVSQDSRILASYIGPSSSSIGIGANGSNLISTSGTYAFGQSPFYIAGLPGGGYQGKMQEILLFSRDMTLSKAALESNINAFYGIY